MRSNMFAKFLVAVGLISTAIPAFGSPASQAFETLKSLAGNWTVTDDTGQTSQASYEVVADGSIVFEHIWGMVTAFSLDGDRILATHYCSSHNQPRMRTGADSTATDLKFEFLDISGLADPMGQHISGLGMHFINANEFEETWTDRVSGQDQPSFTIKYTRAP